MVAASNNENMRASGTLRGRVAWDPPQKNHSKNLEFPASRNAWSSHCFQKVLSNVRAANKKGLYINDIRTRFSLWRVRSVKIADIFLRRAEFHYAFVMMADLGTLRGNLANLEAATSPRKAASSPTV
jgi:hypothetical protein